MVRTLLFCLALAAPTAALAQAQDEQLVRKVDMILTEAGFNDVDASSLSEAELTEIISVSEGEDEHAGRDQIEQILQQAGKM